MIQTRSPDQLSSFWAFSQELGPLTGTNFAMGSVWEISARFPRWKKGKGPKDEFWREIRETKQTVGKFCIA